MRDPHGDRLYPENPVKSDESEDVQRSRQRIACEEAKPSAQA